MYRNGCKLSDITFEDILQNQRHITDLELKIIDQTFAVHFNLPWVNGISLPKSILAGYYCYPSKLDLEGAARSDTLYKWYKGKVVSSTMHLRYRLNYQFIYNLLTGTKWQRY